MFTFLFKPTNACNLRCKYCFIQDSIKSSSKMMTLDLAKKIIDKIASFLATHGQSACQIIWHGGEPLLWKASNYDEALSYMNTSYPEIVWKNAMQTNLTLLTDEHIKIIKKHNICLSTSMDGYEELHNQTRVTSDGEGSHSIVVKKIKALKENGIDFGLIVVLTSQNIGNIIDIYRYYKGFSQGFLINPLLMEGEAKANGELSITPEEYSTAMIRLFDYWIKDDDAVPISNFIEWTSSVATKLTSICSFCKNCQEIFTVIEPNGNIAPCDRFCGHKEYIFGNIQNDDLEQIYDRKSKAFAQRSNILKETECKDCKYWEICFGGCPSESAGGIEDINRKSIYCESIKTIYGHIESFITNHLIP